MNKFLYKYNKYFKILISFLFYLYISKRFRHSLEEKLIIKELISKKDSLKKFPKNKDELLILEKEKLLEFISQRIGKNITKIKSIFIGNRMRFGNGLITIYKLLIKNIK